MTSQLTTIQPSFIGYAKASKADNTKRAYSSQLAKFKAWGGTIPTHPIKLAQYLAYLADSNLSVATIEQALAAIQSAHKLLDLPVPTASPTMAGIRRVKGKPQKQAKPILPVDLARMTARASPRDKAILLLGFAGAFRRSELTALNQDDLEFTSEGIMVRVVSSKTDQESRGRTVAIPYGSTDLCPVRAIRAILDGLPATGTLFLSRTGKRLSPKDINRVIKRLDPQFSGHSLRAGLATAAAKAGATEAQIMETTGHKSVAMVRRYVREANKFNNAASKGLL